MHTEAFLPTQNEDGTLSAQDISVTTSSANVALAVNGKMLYLSNYGSFALVLGFTNNSAATIAPGQGIAIPSMRTQIITRPDRSRYIITLASGATTLNIVGGTGV